MVFFHISQATMSVRLVKSGRWNPPVGTCGWGAHPHTEDAEEVEDPLSDILSKSAVDTSSDPGGGGGEGLGAPSATNTGAVAGAIGFTMAGAVSIGALAMLACTGGATACVASRAGANRAAMGGGGKEYGGGETPIRIGVIGEVEENLTVEGIRYDSESGLTLESGARVSIPCTGP